MVTGIAKISCKELPPTLKALPRTPDPSKHCTGKAVRIAQAAGSLLAHRSERALGQSPHLRARRRPVKMLMAMAKMSIEGRPPKAMQHALGGCHCCLIGILR